MFLSLWNLLIVKTNKLSSATLLYNYAAEQWNLLKYITTARFYSN